MPDPRSFARELHLDEVQLRFLFILSPDVRANAASIGHAVLSERVWTDSFSAFGQIMKLFNFQAAVDQTRREITMRVNPTLDELYNFGLVEAKFTEGETKFFLTTRGERMRANKMNECPYGPKWMEQWDSCAHE